MTPLMTRNLPLKRKTRSTSEPVLYKANYRSGLEERIAGQLTQAGVSFEYEKTKIKYTVPARQATYTPDFMMGDILIEAKGYFRKPADRQKLALVKQQHPEKDIRLVFQRASNPIYSGSKTTYGQWADDHGFPWADGGKIPEEWIEEVTERKVADASLHKG